MVTYEDLLQRQIITKIATIEKDKYVSFHLTNYQIDFQSCQSFLAQQNTKYTIIAGDYTILNITLWHFAKYFNLKISEEDTGVHTNCLIVLEKFIKEESLKQKIIALLSQAQEEFISFTTLKKSPEQTLPFILKQSSDKRKRYTYYSSQRFLPHETDQYKEAHLFLENVVKPYIYIMEHLTC